MASPLRRCATATLLPRVSRRQRLRLCHYAITPPLRFITPLFRQLRRRCAAVEVAMLIFTAIIIATTILHHRYRHFHRFCRIYVTIHSMIR